jgi:phage tail-like protein
MAFGTPRSFHKKFKFLYEIDGFSFFGFQKCSELSAEIAKIEYHEGGAILPDKSPGRVTVADLTIERAATADEDMFTWFKQVANLVSQSGLVEPEFKRDGDLMQLDRDGTELRGWTTAGLWPTKFVAGSWDNEADENVIESMVLAMDTFDKTAGV